MRKVVAILAGVGLLTAVLLVKRTAVVTVETPPEPVAEAQAQAAPSSAIEEKPTINIPEDSSPRGEFERLVRTDAGPDRLNAMLKLARSWAEQNPQKAAETFLTQTSGSERARGVAQAVSVWAKTDPTAALEWLSQTPMDPTLATTIRTQLYATWAAINPNSAVENAVAGGFTGPELNAIFSSWATHNLEAAIQYQDDKLPPSLQKQIWPVLLLTAAAQKSPFADSLFDDFFASNPTPAELLAIGKTLSGNSPHLAGLVADRMPASEGEVLRRRISSLHPDFLQTAGNVTDTSDASVAAAPRVLIPEAGGEPANSIPR